MGTYQPKPEGLKALTYNRAMIARRGLKYEHLDQMTIDIITGTR